ncbi:hypothetical protein HAX54_035678 [Datura stramonium]|uniref:Glycosyltransferase n=1 Tax=Datura stramonium TaxID=4076 RepID=A0ABS8VIE9_DATST|nr:hypothetical protein [Datura stramonium]
METSIPHVLIFPLPLQSTINSTLQLAELLCLAGGLRVTFLNTNHNQQRLLRHSDVQSRFEQYPGFRFLTISDGLPEDHPRSAEQFGDIISSLQSVAEPFLKEMLSDDVAVTCVIPDGLFYYAVDIGNEMGVPVIIFDTISPSCLWVYLCLPKLIEAGVLPFKGNLDALVTNVPALEGLLRRRDLPHFCLLDYRTDQNFQAVFKEIERIPKAHGLILNSFEDLDGPFLSCIRSYSPKTYAIGPVHLNLQTRLAAKATPLLSSSNSLWEEDHTSIKWLDEQSIGSVIYVSFGSLAVVSRNEMLEFWHGLMNSKVKFLWVMRPNMLKGGESHDQLMKELAEDCKGTGYIVSWAPQKMVLAHPSVGGFLTHSGWNSTLESVVEGKPMICWPQYVDQRVTSRLVNEFWKIGLDMKDICDRSVVEKMVKDLMGTKKDDYKKSVETLSEVAKISVREGGLSCHNLDCLINDIKGLARNGRQMET